MQTLKVDSNVTLQQVFSFSKSSEVPMLLETKEKSAILISPELWRDIEETLYLISQPGMRESLLDGMSAPISDCSLEPGW